MRRSGEVLALCMVLAAVATHPLSAQGSTATVRVNLPVTDLVATMAVSTDVLDLGDISGSELTAGYSDAQGPVVTVRANHAFFVLISAPDPFVGPWAKPVSDVTWSSNGGPYTALTTLGAQLLASSGGASLSRSVDYEVLWSFGQDVPGSYLLRLDFTLDPGS